MDGFAFEGVTWIIMVTIWVLMLAIVTDSAEERSVKQPRQRDPI